MLPLENLSGDPSQDYFADGMTDELITDLAQISTLRVISRTSIMTYKQVRKLLPDIARELNVDAVVEGTVSRSGERIRLTAQLIEVPAERHIWAQIFERDLRDTLPLQANVAHAIADRIHAAMNQPEQVAMAVSKPVDPDAYEAYLKGRFFWNKRTEEGLRKAIEYFNLATEKDPNYARAYSGLADAYALSGDWEYGILSPQDAFSKAKAAATKACRWTTIWLRHTLPLHSSWIFMPGIGPMRRPNTSAQSRFIRATPRRITGMRGILS